ncbi:hypothetical protein B0H17DRAFT_637170 [Mycena rosella]|uniref:Uncharacterized protein n=1 Tax=Mycena rosella TaxID=1033263 RepID=A0AAD7GHL7_MYCRO|nr:hypothetical protein B0H17DRAFT_637170 [Mycena rosella]
MSTSQQSPAIARKIRKYMHYSHQATIEKRDAVEWKLRYGPKNPKNTLRSRGVLCRPKIPKDNYSGPPALGTYLLTIAHESNPRRRRGRICLLQKKFAPSTTSTHSELGNYMRPHQSTDKSDKCYRRYLPQI